VHRNQKRKENTEKVRDLVADADPTGQSSDVTIYIYAGTVLERLPRSLGSRNMNNRGKA
jgi:hypothetical protein